MRKEERQKVFDKYNGKCCYCGCSLVKGWHVDHFNPVWRTSRYLTDANGNRIWDTDKREYKIGAFMEKPENHCENNFMPSCASCNILKGGGDLEGFRKSIANFINSLNSYTNQYKFAKRYGLVEETNKPVVFYFEIFS